MTIVPRIEMQGCGCDALPEAESLITIDNALQRIASYAHVIEGQDEVPLHSANGRVLTEPVVSRAAVPPFDNSAMDGYAIDSTALHGTGPWRLEVRDRVVAGRLSSGRVSGLSAAQIFTGAPIPDGADAVVMQEHVTRLGDFIVLTDKVIPGTHIRTAGEDMAAGTMVLPSGRYLTSRGIAACAAAGYQSVYVRRRIRVALLVTGDEVRAADQGLSTAGIWDVNSPVLMVELNHPSLDLCAVRKAGDDRKTLTAQMASLAENVDLIVTTGGISVGEEDHVKPVMAELGADFLFSGVAMKPGKPVSFGRLGHTLWLGLPGNPLSAFLTWRLFGAALCRYLSGEEGHVSRRRHVVLGCALRHKPGRCELRLVRHAGFDGVGREIVSFDSDTHSARVARLSEMDGVVLIPAEIEHLPEGALLEFQPFVDGYA